MALSATTGISNAASKLWSGASTVVQTAKSAFSLRVMAVALTAFSSLSGLAALAPRTPLPHLQISYSPFIHNGVCGIRLTPFQLINAAHDPQTSTLFNDKTELSYNFDKNVTMPVSKRYFNGYGILYYSPELGDTLDHILLGSAPHKIKAMGRQLLQNFKGLRIFLTDKINGDGEAVDHLKTIYLHPRVLESQDRTYQALVRQLAILSQSHEHKQMFEAASQGKVSRKDYIQKRTLIDYHATLMLQIEPDVTPLKEFLKSREGSEPTRRYGADWDLNFKDVYEERVQRDRLASKASLGEVSKDQFVTEALELAFHSLKRQGKISAAITQAAYIEMYRDSGLDRGLRAEWDRNYRRAYQLRHPTAPRV